MIWYLTDKREYLREAREIGAIYRAVIDSFSVAMTAVHVAALIEDLAKVEIEVTAVVPNGCDPVAFDELMRLRCYGAHSSCPSAPPCEPPSTSPKTPCSPRAIWRSVSACRLAMPFPNSCGAEPPPVAALNQREGLRRCAVASHCCHRAMKSSPHSTCVS
jgi:hypothetical protein